MSPNFCRGRRAHRGSPGAYGGCPGAPRVPPPGAGGGHPPPERRCEERGPRAAGRGRARQEGAEPAAYRAQLFAAGAGRVGRVPVVRGGRGRCLEKGPGAKPGGALRVEGRWLRGRRQVANRSRAARHGPKVSSGLDSMLPAAGAAPGRDMGLEAAPPGPGLLCLSPVVPLSPPTQPRCPRCDLRARCQ